MSKKWDGSVYVMYVYAIISKLGSDNKIALFTTVELRDKSYDDLKYIFNGEEGPKFYIRKNTYLILDRPLSYSELEEARESFEESST